MLKRPKGVLRPSYYPPSTGSEPDHSMKLGPLQQRAVDFLKRAKKPTHFNYRTYQNRRIVDSLERKGVITVFRYPPDASRDVLVTLVTD